MSNAYTEIKRSSKFFFFANFEFDGFILISVARKKNIFPFGHQRTWKKSVGRCKKSQKMTFYVVILGMCKFTVVNDRKGHGVIDFVYPGTYKVILRRQKFGQVRSKFYYIKQDFIVLRGSSNFFKVLCRAFVIVPWVEEFKLVRNGWSGCSNRHHTPWIQVSIILFIEGHNSQTLHNVEFTSYRVVPNKVDLDAFFSKN